MRKARVSRPWTVLAAAIRAFPSMVRGPVLKPPWPRHLVDPGTAGRSQYVPLCLMTAVQRSRLVLFIGKPFFIPIRNSINPTQRCTAACCENDSGAHTMGRSGGTISWSDVLRSPKRLPRFKGFRVSKSRGIVCPGYYGVIWCASMYR
jgi:hypothetical protein